MTPGRKKCYAQNKRGRLPVDDDTDMGMGASLPMTHGDEIIVGHCLWGYNILIILNKDLVARIPENYETGEIDWGDPVGKEVW